MPERREQRRSGSPRPPCAEAAGRDEADLFADLIELLAEELYAVPANAWDTGEHLGTGSLAERLQLLRAVRAAQTEEE
ncbi:MAG TPA: hypothetical protein VHB98_05030 [Chloroflexota bacterium]|jgi:hypothetical protein|nr:hypothetical protein [Chloroflexota bacterium]